MNAYWASQVVSGKEFVCQSRKLRFHPWVRKIPQGRKWQPTLVSLPRKPHGQRRIVAIVPGVSRVGHNLATKTTTINVCSVMLLRKGLANHSSI